MEGDQVNDKTDEGKTETSASTPSTTAKRSGFSFWFGGGHAADGATAKTSKNTSSNKKGNKTPRRTKERAELDTSLLRNTQEFTFDCDLMGNGKSEALRRNNKIRSASESSALDNGNSCGVYDAGEEEEEEKTPSVAAVAVVDGKWRLNGKHHRQTSKSAVHLGDTRYEEDCGPGGDVEDDRRPAQGSCTFDWWFHRRRRSSSKNKAR